MKPTEKAVLAASAIGVAAGFGLTFLIKDANVWLYVGAGVVVAAFFNDQFRKRLLEDRQINGSGSAKGRN